MIRHGANHMFASNDSKILKNFQTSFYLSNICVVFPTGRLVDSAQNKLQKDEVFNMIRHGANHV